MLVSGLDILVLGLYFVLVVGLAVFLARRDSRRSQATSSEDYFLAGRSLGWVAVGLSLIASNLSSTTLIGLSGAAYNTGLSISAYEWMTTFVLVFFAIFFVPYFLGSRIFTLPEFLEKRFDRRSRYYFSGMTILGNMFIDTAGTLFAGALVIHFFFPQVDYWLSATILAVVAGVYTAIGGLRAVVYTDMAQTVILFVGSTVAAYLLYQVAGPWSSIVASTPPEMLSVIRPLSDGTMPWLGLLTGVPILGFYFWCTNQFVVQRVLAAKNVQHARWGILFAAFLKFAAMFILLFPGIMAREVFPGLETPDLVFPTIVAELLPVGLKGLVLAGLIAAIMSSIDSTLHSASTLVTMDFVRPLRPQTTQAQLTLIGRMVTLLFMLVSILWIPVIANFETLFAYLQSSLAFFVPPVVAVFLLGLFWKGATASGAFWGLVVGHVTSLSAFVLQQTGFFPHLHFLIVAGLIFASSALAIALISFCGACPVSLESQQWTWRASGQQVGAVSRAVDERLSWWQDYRLHSALMVVITLSFVIFFW